ncbi:Uncharacterised protein [Klebsiella pneumoniae]|nr:Uncharacterised protein [Klebsiella pneumoniae]SLY12483.1 Uncharacterised protein [Klebsiella pneumoniae]VGP35570.1 hypothetical protein SB00610_01937 [Klebsiella quasipneumoniae subsp. similipneumoniae]
MDVIIQIIGFNRVQTEESHAAGVIPRITLKISEGYFRIKFTYIISPGATVDIFFDRNLHANLIVAGKGHRHSLIIDEIGGKIIGSVTGTSIDFHNARRGIWCTNSSPFAEHP